MSRITAVSFDTDGIRVVAGQHARTGFVVEQTQLLTIDELDSFLSLDQCRDYLIAINPGDALFETITIPPVEAKLEATLIQSETSRLHPELLPFSCGWQVLGDTALEGRTVRKVACCLVPHQNLETLLEPFIRHRKTIRRLVTAPLALATLVNAVEESSSPLLCAYDSGTSKLLFLLEDGAVTFARSISSNERGWDALDRQNVAMTMDYCFQSLRVRPSRILVLNPAQPYDEQTPPPHLEHLQLPQQLQDGLKPEIMQAYQVPFLLAAWPIPTTADLLPDSYRTALLQQAVLQRSNLFFAIASLCLTLLIVAQLFSLRNLQTDIDRLRSREAGLSASYQTYRQVLQQRDQVQPMLSALGNLLTAPGIPATLTSLNGVMTIPQTQINSLTVKRDKDTLILHTDGKISANSYAAIQERFEALGNALLKVGGITLNARQLDPKAQTFAIEAVRKP